MPNFLYFDRRALNEGHLSYMMDRLYERRLLKNKTKIAFFTVNAVILEKFKFLIKRYKAILNFKSEIIF